MTSETEVSSNPKEPRRLSLEDIEEAYLGLMNAYSMGLASLIVERHTHRHWMVPLILRWRTKKRVDMMRATLLLLIAAEKKEGEDKYEDSKIIRKFKLYCEDNKNFSAQIASSGYMSMIFDSVPAIILILFSIVNSLIKTPDDGFKLDLELRGFDFNLIGKFLNWLVPFIQILFYMITLLMSSLLLIQIVLLILGFRESSRIFNRLEISEKDTRFYKLINNYSVYD